MSFKLLHYDNKNITYLKPGLKIYITYKVNKCIIIKTLKKGQKI